MIKKKTNYISEKGFKSLTEEFNNLSRVERPQVVETVKWAASLGDRSENADYIYGKKKLREIDRRIRFLTQRIDDAQIIKISEIKSNKVQFGATLKVAVENLGTRILSIVGIDEIRPANGLISWKSPIARGLLGLEVGDVAEIKTPSGLVEYEILEIEYKDII